MRKKEFLVVQGHAIKGLNNDQAAPRIRQMLCPEVATETVKPLLI